MSRTLDTALVERERELAAIEAAIGELSEGRGRVLFVEGPAGHGKTALLRAARSAALAGGLRVASAVGAEIERDFPFGVVRQLLEPELRAAGEQRQADLFAGSAELARPVFAPADDGSLDASTSFARLHGVYSLAANLAAERPLVLVVDDLHWVDVPSLRFLDVLARRIEDLPVLMALGARPAEAGAAQDLLDGLASGPATELLRPRPLSAAGIGTLLADAVGEIDDAFVQAAAEMTAGSPLLISELLRAVAEEGFAGRADEVARLRASVPSTIARSVVARLRRLAPNALAVARALAVLGERARAGDVAALAEVPEEAVAEAHVALARAGLLDVQELRFLHPLVREAVHADLVGTEQARWHARAAALVAAGGGDAEDVAAHLVVSEPAGTAWSVDALAEAGRRALQSGAPEVALRYLERALREPPAGERRQSLVLQLGEAEARMGVPGAISHLEEAAAGEDADLARQANRTRAQLLVVLDRAPEAADVLREAVAAARATGDPHADELADDLIDVLAQGSTLPEEYWERLGAADPRTASPTILSHLAFTRAISGAPAEEVLRLARRALAGRTARAADTRFTHYYAIEALMMVEAAGEAAAALREASSVGKRFGGRAVTGPLTYMPSALSAWERHFGDLERAEELARYGLDLMLAAGAPRYADSLRAALACVLLDRGRLDAAEDVLAVLPPRESGAGIKEIHAHRARLRLLQRRPEEALEEIELELELERRRGWAVGNRGHSRTLRVHVLAALGRAGEATQAARAELDLARSRGIAGAEARAWLALAVAQDGDAAIDALREAVGAARRSPVTRLRAEALTELGSALRRGKQRVEARPLLTEARDLARRCGATAIEERAHEELVIAGGRPQRVALSGLESLTAAERRVAELAAQGLKNRDIAEALFVTLKTVEVHLGRAYSKLDIKGRSQLAAALAAEAE